MISVYINPDKTQILQGSLKKQLVGISTWRETGSCWNALENGRTDGLASLMQEIKSISKDSYEEVYITIADIIFTTVSCFQNGSEQLFSQQLKNTLEGRINSHYIVTPYETRPPFRPKKTIYAVKKTIIDALLAAAKEAGVTLTSIEPSSVSYARARQVWQQDYAVVEIFKQHACIFTFSPIGGVFRQDAANISADELTGNQAQAEDTILTNYTLNTFTGGNFFRVISSDLKYTVLTDARCIRDMEVVKKNSEKKLISFPEFVSGGPTPGEQLKWMIAVGALIQDYPNKELLYPAKPSGFVLLSSNIIPQEYQNETALEKKKAYASKGLRALAASLALIIAGELGGIFWFNQEQIEPAAQQSYNQAKKENEAIRKSLDVVKKAKAEDAQVYQYLLALLKNRPDDCLFSQASIGDGKQAGKANTQNFVKLKTHSRNQISFNNYIGNLLQDKHFVNPVIETVQQKSNTGYMTSTIQIGKGAAFKDGES